LGCDVITEGSCGTVLLTEGYGEEVIKSFFFFFFTHSVHLHMSKVLGLFSEEDSWMMAWKKRVEARLCYL
jgi:hypothetical protein